MEPYISTLWMIHTAVVWPLLIYGIFFSDNANVRWMMFFFALLQLASKAASWLVSATAAPGWAYHLAMVGLALFAYRRLTIFRPLFSYALSRYTRHIPWICDVLPTLTQPRIYNAEMALKYVYVGMALMHLLVLVQWLSVAMQWGWTATGGLFEQLGLSRTILFDCSLMIFCLVVLLNVVLWICLLIPRCRERWILYKA